MPNAAPRFHIEEIRFAERDVVLRLPFRFGAATVTSCPQVYVRARIRFADGRTREGCAAEMMIPKWFDKNPALSNEDNFAQLRQALSTTRDAYTAPAPANTAWGHFASHYVDGLDAGQRAGRNPLVSSYGPALIDRAVLDALCLDAGLGFGAAMSSDLCGVDPNHHGLAPDLAGFDMGAFLRAQRPRHRIAARHTVGLADAIRDADWTAPAPHDGLPSSLEAVVARYGHRHFKLKLSGDDAGDLARLARIAEVIDPVAECVTLDGNEQYADAAAFAHFLDALFAEPALRTLVAKTAFIEQPIQRATALALDMRHIASRMPMLVDESDSTLDSFGAAQALGYTGVSSKSCKGFYKSVINAARCAQGHARGGSALFLSGEDLTMQAGIGVQQDLALVAWLGLAHVERNGHHYVNGMAALPAEEQSAFLARHAPLYEHSDGATRLRIVRGELDLSSLHAPGFATGVEGSDIQWDAMRTNW
ncbi:enolase C-terminal domain-like protein [Variovorax sp. PAMC 28711]|uniref:enolase C-terminal domain-like protein n=1 Tax=Variovorax sp. PAMC 28711 TaxID=1795631 RepID=UPI00078DDB56|nr:enolase C-terminal domain-like protein [Variovorax sp. PAMC 28711]AMM25889.1 hypothetical protein AX767_17150 [Variovorax sp. PAMC 28711]